MRNDERSTLEEIVKKYFPNLPQDARRLQSVLPSLAKDRRAVQAIRLAIKEMATHHQLFLRDARTMTDVLEPGSVHLVVTSPPYWILKKYPEREGQLGLIEDYEKFLDELDEVWRQCYQLLVPGGRLIIVVGDVCLSRRKFGRHIVMPLHASIQERCRYLGFDNLAPIIWYKIANASLEVENGSSFLGKPYEPNAIIKNDVEYILMQRKPGAYRKPTLAMRILSLIPEESHKEWFQQIWQLPGASTRNHPAPFPLELAARLVRMFSFIGDTVLDPFMGTGTTNVAACHWGRNSVGFEIDPHYFRYAEERLRQEGASLFSRNSIETYT